MNKTDKRGQVEFHPPMVKLTADLPGDENMRQHLDEMKANDGYKGACVTLSPDALKQRKDVDIDE
ncbi:hypothetical protein Q5741_10090 [Paenibacillus sp. JX-17]|uniref:Uncharacterized protein n=1 Tax=Paenibacillus lacisoli TaxID=3064525 RepID=A0ABT9CDX1_9BACL|nr:hypothetical protein [Paenibacillus sp. JX-17]